MSSFTSEEAQYYSHSSSRTRAGYSIKVFYDEEGVTSGSKTSNSNNCEPAWSYRLWESSISLSKYIENGIFESIKGKNILELGAGTGLISLVLANIGANLVVCTDLPHALPLLKHNAKYNLGNKEFNLLLSENLSSNSDSIGFKSLTCTSGHILSQSITESDEYMCNICEEDIPDNSIIFRCYECNFDVCNQCHIKVVSGMNFESLPHWYRIHCQDHHHNPNNVIKDPITSMDGRFDDVEEEKEVLQSMDHSSHINSDESFQTEYPNLHLKPFHLSKPSSAGWNPRISTLLVHPYDWTDNDAPVKLHAVINTMKKYVHVCPNVSYEVLYFTSFKLHIGIVYCIIKDTLIIVLFLPPLDDRMLSPLPTSAPTDHDGIIQELSVSFII